jgi:hypothetical protein
MRSISRRTALFVSSAGLDRGHPACLDTVLSFSTSTGARADADVNGARAQDEQRT